MTGWAVVALGYALAAAVWGLLLARVLLADRRRR